MRVIVEGTTYDTDMADLIEEIGYNDDIPTKGERLYRTRAGAFFLCGHFLMINSFWRQDCTEEEAQDWLARHGDDLVEDIRPLTDAEARRWLERFGNAFEELAMADALYALGKLADAVDALVTGDGGDHRLFEAAEALLLIRRDIPDGDLRRDLVTQEMIDAGSDELRGYDEFTPSAEIVRQVLLAMLEVAPESFFQAMLRRRSKS